MTKDKIYEELSDWETPCMGCFTFGKVVVVPQYEGGSFLCLHEWGSPREILDIISYRSIKSIRRDWGECLYINERMVIDHGKYVEGWCDNPPAEVKV